MGAFFVYGAVEGIQQAAHFVRGLRPRLPFRSPSDRSLLEAPLALLAYARALTGSNPSPKRTNKKSEPMTPIFYMVRSKGFEPPWSPTRT